MAYAVSRCCMLTPLNSGKLLARLVHVHNTQPSLREVVTVKTVRIIPDFTVTTVSCETVQCRHYTVQCLAFKLTIC